MGEREGYRRGPLYLDAVGIDTLVIHFPTGPVFGVPKPGAPPESLPSMEHPPESLEHPLEELKRMWWAIWPWHKCKKESEAER